MSNRPMNIFEWFCVKVLLFIEYLAMGRRMQSRGSFIVYFSVFSTLLALTVVALWDRGFSTAITVTIVMQLLLNGLLTATVEWIHERQHFYADKRNRVE